MTNRVDEIASIDLLLLPLAEDTAPNKIPEIPPAPARTGISTGSTRPPPAKPAVPTADASADSPQSTDWDDAAKLAAAHALAGKAPQGRVFGETKVSPYRDCQRKKRSWQWIPERQKGGFSGGLPWVQVSDHCIVGLGFFACAIGELPPPRSDLLDDLNTPNQMESTVPGIEDCVEESPPSE